MRLEYENTLADWDAAQEHALETYKPFTEGVVSWRWGLGVGVFLTSLVAPLGAALLPRVVVGLVLGGGLWWSFPRSMRAVALHRMKGAGSARAAGGGDGPPLRDDDNGALRQQHRGGERRH